MRAKAVIAIVAGAAMLAWPAALNGYPLLFSDTGGFLAQTLVPLMIWDKPWVYGPLLHLFHWRLTLWLPLAAQALLVSHLLWLTGRTLWGRRPAWHLALCAAAALLTTAPFTIALLMPDVFAPVVLLCAYLLGFATDRLSRRETLWVGLVATIGIAAHLSHLPLALALAVLGALMTRRLAPTLRMAAPLAGAILLLLATNWVGHGRVSLSPHGATFLLARLQDDGPAARTIQAECPARGWYLCAFADRLPMDSDDFLWLPQSPVNRDAEGRARFLGGALLSPEAREIVAETLRREPGAVAAAMIRNALRQVALAQAGDTLVPDHLDAAVGTRIRDYFPNPERTRYAAALQTQGLLPDAIAPFLLPHLPILLLALPLTALGFWRAARTGNLHAFAFLLLVLGGCAANALATGALSKPHHRYEARILWLLPLAGAMAVVASRGGLRPPRTPPARSLEAPGPASLGAMSGHGAKDGGVRGMPPCPGGEGPGGAAPLPGRAAAIVAGALLLGWPAFLNGYPLVFIDTVSYLAQTIVPEMPWDKAPAYGPFLHAFHWRVSLWGAWSAQALLLSWVLWLTQRAVRGRVGPVAHLVLCGAMAALTSLPWFAATLMPDVLSGVAALAVVLLGTARGRLSRAEAVALVTVGGFAVAAHLTHLVVAAAVVALVAVLERRRAAILWAAAVPVLAVAVLLAANFFGHGRAVLSPNGAIFLLARLQADGPAAATIRERCPAAGWYLCDFADRLPMDSDAFLWDPTSPVSRDAAGNARFMGSVALVPEARAIVAATLADRPLAVARAMVGNALAQLSMPLVGDTLSAAHLDLSARRMVQDGFPARELAAFDAGLQMRGLLPGAAAPSLLPHLPVLIAAIPLALLGLRRGGREQRALVLAAAVAIVANAAAAGALSKPHHRYEARIVWLLPLAAGLALAWRRDGSAGEQAGHAAGPS
jgi:hypothetical protein